MSNVLIFIQKTAKQWKIILFGTLLTANFFILYIYCRENSRGILTVAMLDIGQGDAILIEAPNGNKIMIDGGPDGVVLRRLGETLPFFERNLDMLIVSNPDKDHMGGFIPVLNSYQVANVMEPGTISPSATYEALESTILQKKVPKIIAERGMKITLSPDIYLYILFPDRDASKLKTNDGSIVAKLIYKNTSIMLMGDAPQKIEKYLIELDGNNLKSDILKAGHHGSKTSTVPSFVQTVSPQYALISAGLHNMYGHPNKETIQTLQKSHVKIFSTLGKGTIYMYSDGEGWTERQ